MPNNTQQKQHDSLYDAVKQLGTTDGEAGLYVLSLRVGPQPVADLAERIGVSRPNMYKLIRGLELKGLAISPKSGSKTKRFSVLSPTIVRELLEKKLREDQEVQRGFSSILPDLLSKYKRGDLPSNVRIYQGRGQYLDAFFGMLDESKDACDFFGSIDDFLKLIDLENQNVYLIERVKRGVTSRVLTRFGKEAERIAGEDRERLRETRVLSNLGPFSASFHFYADKVMFWQPDGLLAIRIEDNLVVEMLKSVYEFLWMSAKRPSTSNLDPL